MQRQQILGEEGAEVRVADREGEQGRVPAPQPAYAGSTALARCMRRT
jgi:hypothetical protein